LISLLFAPAAFAYDGDLHQTFTFLAAKQFNRCVEDTAIPSLTPLQVRYIAKSSVAQADPNLFVRMFRWNYYDSKDHSEGSTLWLFKTRFHNRFEELLNRLDEAADEGDLYREFGRIVSFLQMVSAPARVVPVYTGRFWRLSFSDRFDQFPLDEAALARLIESDCSFLESTAADFDRILAETAQQTMAAVASPIEGLPVSWEVFWQPAREAGDFGEYGPAGNNFGRKTSFSCGAGKPCLLLDDDPLYEEFALQRHASAVRATMRAMYLLQTRSSLSLEQNAKR
jgi:hypothetical protein